MSQSTAGPGNHLSDVLSRIHALTQQSMMVPAPAADAIPRLTEAYVGHQDLQFLAMQAATLPTLHQEFVQPAEPHQSETSPVLMPDVVSEETPQAISPEQQESLLRAMEPVIKTAVRKAILSELVVLEKALKTTLQQDMMDALKERIESGQF